VEVRSFVSGWSRSRIGGRPSAEDPPAVRAVGAPDTTRLDGIDGLRALAACSILVYHVWLYSQPGGQLVDFGPVTRYVLPHLPLGVTLFFTLSAFLLYRPIVAAIVDGRPRPRVGTYLLNRGLRIMPAYLVVLVVVAVVLPAAMLRTGPTTLELGRMVGDPPLLLRNAALAQNYAPESLLTGITPAWSLAVEAVFYLVLPLLGGLAAAVAAARRVDGRSRLIAALTPAAVLLAVGLSGKAVAASWIVSTGSPSAGWDGDWHSVIVRSFWGQADLFTFGIVLAVVYVGLERSLISFPRWWRWPVSAGILGAAVAITILADHGRWSAGTNPYELTGALGCALLLALVVLHPVDTDVRPRPLVRLLTTRVAVVVGLCSYSIFLWHEPLVRLLRSQGWTFAGQKGWILNLVLVMVITAVAATATYRWVEKPALRRKRRPASVDGAGGPDVSVADPSQATHSQQDMRMR
jgi:peptidoglycan/LPS O-acetylase OafA/YrhL